MADVFIDFSAANDGDGTAHTQAGSPGGAGAFNTIVGKTFTSGDQVWMRRESLTLASTLTLSTAGIDYIGWPESGDPNYDSRPVAPRATWDGDAKDYAILTKSDAGVLCTVDTSADQELHRIHFESTFTASTSTTAIDVDVDAEFHFCKMETRGDSASSESLDVANSIAPKFFDCVLESEDSTPCLELGAESEPTFVRCTFSVDNADSGMNVFDNGSGSPYFDECTFTIEDGLGKIYSDAGSNEHSMFNCTLVGPTGNTNILFDSGGHGSYRGLDITADGDQVILGDAPVHIKKFTQIGGTESYGIQIDGGAFHLIENATFRTGGNSSADIQYNSKGAIILMRNPAFKTSPPIEFSQPALGGGVFILDYNGTAGDWRFISDRGQIVSSATSRSGGESFSMKMEQNAEEDQEMKSLPMGIPGLETIFANLVSGSNTITIYGAHKNYGTAPTKRDLWIEISYLRNAGDQIREFATSRADDALESDGSSWSGDTGLTTFKLVLTVTAGQAGLMPITIGLRKYDASGYVYIDPKPVVT